ncbi:hypothetical protein ADL28_44720 [Streptomyces violaceusniger]|uniref:Uncharacterized protein n=2 Tax=Streptomyces violaceusniger group TaxID=2839105 RepID=A0A0X3VD44_STRVO|nr:hypothetical protein ADL28_44720 [Streptomyces violaceusniger]
MLDTRWPRMLPQVRSGEAILERYARQVSAAYSSGKERLTVTASFPAAPWTRAVSPSPTSIRLMAW